MNPIINPPPSGLTGRTERVAQPFAALLPLASGEIREQFDSRPRPWPTELDARGPKPPDPLTAILVALDAIPAGHSQYVRTRDRPTELLRTLAARGVVATTSEFADGSWRTLVYRRKSVAG